MKNSEIEELKQENKRLEERNGKLIYEKANLLLDIEVYRKMLQTAIKALQLYAFENQELRTKDGSVVLKFKNESWSVAKEALTEIQRGEVWIKNNH